MVDSFTKSHPDWRKKQGGQPGPRGVFHCFSGDLEAAQRVISARFYVSFPGIVTFKNASSVHEVAARVPLDDLLVETDSPYMTPVPHRGERNEPSNVRLVAARVAELQHLPLEDIERITTYNSFDLFGVGDPEPLDAA